MREPKSVTAGIRRRGRWGVVGDRGNKGALKVEDAVMYASESLEFELDISCSEPFEESDFVIREERLLKDICDPLTLLCMRQRVVDVAGNDGLK